MATDHSARLLSAFENDGKHAEYEELEALLDGRADEADQRRLRLHFEKCEACAAEFHDLQAFSQTTQKSQSSRRVWYFGTAIAAAAAGVFFTTGVTRKRPAELAPLVTSIREGATVNGLDSAGILHGMESATPDQRALIRQVLQTGSLPSGPATLDDLRRNREVLLGPQASAQTGLRAVSPAGIVVPDGRPQFTWEAPQGASQFIVSVFTTDFEPAAKSQPLETNGWRSDKPLADGATFVWTVSAVINGRRVTVPHSPEPEVRFRVATSAERLELENAPGNLLKAAVAARLGMMDAAGAALDQVAAANPGSPLVKSLRSTLK